MTKLDQKLKGLRKNDFDFTPSDNQKVYVYLKKTYRSGNIKWRINKISDNEITFDDIEAHNGYKQLIVVGNIKVNKNYTSKYCDIIDHSIIEKSPVKKPKDTIKKYLVDLWDMCFQNEELQSINRKPKVDDFKVTTVWGERKAGHMGKLPLNQDENFKLGVNWQTWHSQDSEDKIRFLTHELTHLTHPHHRKSFFITRTEAINSIIESIEYQNQVQSWFGNIDWNMVKSKTLREPHRQSSDIKLNGERCRLDAVNKVVKEMESILCYNYRVAQRFYLNPPLSELKVGYINNVSEDRYNLVKISELDFNSNIEDYKLNSFINKNLIDENSYGFNYGLDELPEVKDNKVISNNEYVNIILKMKKSINNTNSSNSDDLDIKIPVVKS